MIPTLLVYNKRLDIVVAFIGDNCSTNRKILNDCGIPLIGCANHRFNVAVKKWLENEVIFKQDKMVVELRKLKDAARLRSLTDLCAGGKNKTRWSFKYDSMAICFESIQTTFTGFIDGAFEEVPEYDKKSTKKGISAQEIYF